MLTSPLSADAPESFPSAAIASHGLESAFIQNQTQLQETHLLHPSKKDLLKALCKYSLILRIC